MANVKFYRLGSVNPISYGFYATYKQDGNLVFANVKDENNIVHQYIWANGIEYHVDLQAADFLKLVNNDKSNVKVDTSDGLLTFNADLDISGEMIDVVEWDGQYYDARDTEHEHPLNDSTIVEHGEGKYLKLKLGEDDVYIWSKDLISLDNYYTKGEVDEKIADVSDALQDYVDEKIENVSLAIDDLKDYVNQKDEELNDRIAEVSAALDEYIDATDKKIDEIDASIDRLDASVNAIEEKIEDQHALIEEIGEKVEETIADVSALHVDVSALQDAVEDLSTKLEEDVVYSVDSENEFVNVTPNKGNVKIDLEVVKATDDSSFPSHGLVTDGYVDEKMAWVEIEETVDPADIQSGSVSEDGPIDMVLPESFDSDAMEVTSANGDVTIN